MGDAFFRRLISAREVTQEPQCSPYNTELVIMRPIIGPRACTPALLVVPIAVRLYLLYSGVYLVILSNLAGDIRIQDELGGLLLEPRNE